MMVYGGLDGERQARQGLDKLQQTGSVSAYIAKFREYDSQILVHPRSKGDKCH